MSTEERKRDHLDLCLHRDVDSARVNYWNEVTLPHCALPDLCLTKIKLACNFLNKAYSAPFLISSMTGGTAEGHVINLRLAQLSQEFQIPMGVGSQRVAFETPARRAEFAELKNKFPKSRLWANVGLVQLNYGVGARELGDAIDMIGAEALVLHLNPLQEALQPEGDTNFAGLLKKFEEVRPLIKSPVVIKETGCGLDTTSAARLVAAGADALDIAGMGGTHWGYIEGLRRQDHPGLGEWFRSWGIPTPQALRDVHELAPHVPLIASGGLRSGLDAAKSIYCGAHLAGMAKPYLKAAAVGYPELKTFHLANEHALRVAMFCSNHSTLTDLRSANPS